MRVLIQSQILALALMALAGGSAHAQQGGNLFANPQNLQVLPADIPPARLSAIMRGFTRQLGVRCSTCHMGTEDIPITEYDFASDEKAMKRNARVMLQMVMEINGTVSGIERPEGRDQLRVTCVTCHRGQQRPLMIQDVLADAAEEGGAAAAAEKYKELRAQYYGGFQYDFTAPVLIEFADSVAAGGDPEGGVSLHQLNVEMNPGVIGSYAGLGRAYERMQMPEKALELYEKALVDSPEWERQLTPAINRLRNLVESGQDQQK